MLYHWGLVSCLPSNLSYIFNSSTAYRHLYPPTRVCRDDQCINYRRDDSLKIRTLTDPVTHKATLFTLNEGPLPVYTTSFYCKGTSLHIHEDICTKFTYKACNRRYHHNYSTHADSDTREYYGSVPDVIQVVQHSFMESSLLEFYIVSKALAW